MDLVVAATAAAVRPSSSSSIPTCYVCPCMNVQLHRVVPCKDVDKPDEDDNDNAINRNYGDPFFVNAIKIEVSPDDQGGFAVSKKVECLCCTRPVAGKWLVTSCLNCRVDTHAVPVIANDEIDHQQQQRRRCCSTLYVSRKMNTDLSKVSTLSQSDDYSRVYEIIVRPFMANEGQSMATFGVIDERAADNRSEELKRLASAFIDAQRESVEERIREYNKLQLSNFKQLESRIQQDKNILLQRIASAIQDGVGGRIPSTFPHAAARPSSAADAAAASSSAKQSAAKSATATSAIPDHNSHTSFDVFAMDEDDVFSASEPEDGSTSDEDECPSDDAPPLVSASSFAAAAAATSDARLFATSLPVSMPLAAWKGPSAITSRRLVEEDGSQNNSISSDKDNFKTDDPEWMAASIKALAMSVRGDDSTDLFGARPRPRLNTLD